jgi:hypothetical protein
MVNLSDAFILIAIVVLAILGIVLYIATKVSGYVRHNIRSI